MASRGVAQSVPAEPKIPPRSLSPPLQVQGFERGQTVGLAVGVDELGSSQSFSAWLRASPSVGRRAASAYGPALAKRKVCRAIATAAAPAAKVAPSSGAKTFRIATSSSFPRSWGQEPSVGRTRSPSRQVKGGFNSRTSRPNSKPLGASARRSSSAEPAGLRLAWPRVGRRRGTRSTARRPHPARGSCGTPR